MQYKSLALWPEGTINGNEDNLSEDTHGSEFDARTVTNLLCRNGFGGDGEVFPVSAWVEPCEEPTEETEYVLLKGVVPENMGCRFFSQYKKGQKDPRRSATGEVWYGLIGYAKTVEEAQIRLYGKVCG